MHVMPSNAVLKLYMSLHRSRAGCDYKCGAMPMRVSAETMDHYFVFTVIQGQIWGFFYRGTNIPIADFAYTCCMQASNKVLTVGGATRSFALNASVTQFS